MYAVNSRYKFGVVFFVVSLVLFPSSAVQAGALFELTGANQGLGGFNARVIGASPASTYFNPALIPLAEPGLQLGVFFVSDQVSATLDARPKAVVDVPVGVRSYANDDRSAFPLVPIPTSWLESGYGQSGLHKRQSEGSSGVTRSYSTVGLITPVYERYLVLGLNAAIPLGGFTAAKAFYNDEREQYFSNSLHPELYSDRLDAAELAFGVGGRPFKGLSLGVSFTLSIQNSAVTPVYVSDAANLSNVLIDADIRVNTVVSPHFGVVVEPIERLRLGATLHTAQSMQVNTDFSYLLNSGTKQRASIAFTHGYVPWSVSLGCSFELIEPPPESPEDHRIYLVGTALMTNWNEYRDRHNQRPSGAYAWSRTVNPSLGARWMYSGWGTMLDFNYVPSPVPLQTGRTNYVDNDRIGAVAGFQYSFRLAEAKFRVGLQLQAHYLIERYQKKLATAAFASATSQSGSLVIDEVPDNAIDLANGGQAAAGRTGLQTNNPGWPGFSSQGWIIGGGAQIAYFFK